MANYNDTSLYGGETEGDDPLSAKSPNDPGEVTTKEPTGLDAKPKKAQSILTGDGNIIGDTVKSSEKALTPAAPAKPSVWEDLANELVAQYSQTINELNPQTSGKTAAAFDASASSQAEADLGQSSTSPMAQWLNGINSASQAQSAASGVTGAEANVSAVEDTGAAGIGKALQNLGVAETEEMQAAPYQQLLQSLASEVPYRLSQGYPTPALADAPKWLQAAEQAAGVSSTGTANIPGTATKSLPPVSSSLPASPISTSLAQPSYSFAQGQ